MRTTSWIAALVLTLLPLAESGQGPAAQHTGAPVLAFKAGTVEMADWELALRIRQLLAKDADLAPLNSGVHVNEGIVTLSGPVPSPYFRRRAEERVLTVPGVRQVRNELAVRGSPGLEPGLARRSAPVDQTGPPPPLQRLIGPPQPRIKPGPPVARLASRVDIDPDNAGAPDQPAAQARVRPDHGNRSQEWAPSDLRFAVERILRNNPRFEKVSATISDGQVVLAGHVGAAGDRDDLAAAIRALDGVHSLRYEHVVIHRYAP